MPHPRPDSCWARPRRNSRARTFRPLSKLRSNWSIYIEEFAVAIEHATGLVPVVRTLDPEACALSSFEAKYRASGHAMWSLQIEVADPKQRALLARSSTDPCPSTRPSNDDASGVGPEIEQ